MKVWGFYAIYDVQACAHVKQSFQLNGHKEINNKRHALTKLCLISVRTW